MSTMHMFRCFRALELAGDIGIERSYCSPIQVRSFCQLEVRADLSLQLSIVVAASKTSDVADEKMAGCTTHLRVMSQQEYFQVTLLMGSGWMLTILCKTFSCSTSKGKCSGLMTGISCMIRCISSLPTPMVKLVGGQTFAS